MSNTKAKHGTSRLLGLLARGMLVGMKVSGLKTVKLILRYFSLKMSPKRVRNEEEKNNNIFKST